MAKLDMHQQVTDSIIEAMEVGRIPWNKDWSIVGAPKNRITGNDYSGINFLILSLSGYESDQWLTFKQAKELGGTVKKGEGGTKIIFYKNVRKTDEAGEEEKYSLMRSYTVFNIDQCEGIKSTTGSRTLHDPQGHAQKIEQIRQQNDINIIHGNPAYDSRWDAVKLPDLSEFETEEGYCRTAIHEFSHWTGHKTRLDRFTSFDGVLSTSNELYAAEELVAELSAAMICSEIGVESITQHAAYIQTWLKQLKNDKKYIFKAAAKANSAVKYLTKT